MLDPCYDDGHRRSCRLPLWCWIFNAAEEPLDHHAGRTHHINGDAVNVIWNTGLYRRLSRDQLPVARSQHISEDDQVERISVDCCPIDGGFHNVGSQIYR